MASTDVWPVCSRIYPYFNITSAGTLGNTGLVATMNTPRHPGPGGEVMPGLVVQEMTVFNVHWIKGGHVRTTVISREVVGCEVSDALSPLDMRIAVPPSCLYHQRWEGLGEGGRRTGHLHTFATFSIWTRTSVDCCLSVCGTWPVVGFCEGSLRERS